MQTLYLIRGLPGSGKSTFVRNNLLSANPKLKHFEADMFFERDGEYVYNPKLIRNAHEWCLNETKKALQQGFTVAVSNTFTQLWELKSYIDLAKEFGVDLKIIKAEGNFKNVHGVPEEALKKMEQRWQDVQNEETFKQFFARTKKSPRD